MRTSVFPHPCTKGRAFPMRTHAGPHVIQHAGVRAEARGVELHAAGRLAHSCSLRTRTRISVRCACACTWQRVQGKGHQHRAAAAQEWAKMQRGRTRGNTQRWWRIARSICPALCSDAPVTNVARWRGGHLPQNSAVWSRLMRAAAPLPFLRRVACTGSSCASLCCDTFLVRGKTRASSYLSVTVLRLRTARGASVLRNENFELEREESEPSKDQRKAHPGPPGPKTKAARVTSPGAQPESFNPVPGPRYAGNLSR